MLVNFRRAVLLVVVVLVIGPALAIAAPKGHKKPKATAKPVVEAPATDKGATDAKPEGATDAKPADTKPAAPAVTPPVTTPAMPAASGGGGAGGASGAASAGGTGAPAAEAPAPANEPDVDALRQEYLSLRDELFKSRARANAVASQLYSTRVTIRFTWASGRFYGVTKASIRLDGANVYEDAAGGIAGDDGVRFDGYVAPGRHLVTFHVEATGKDDDSFTSSTESQIVVKAIANKDLIVAAKARDAGDIAYEWKKSEHGSYGLGIDVAVKTVAHADAAPGAKK